MKKARPAWQLEPAFCVVCNTSCDKKWRVGQHFFHFQCLQRTHVQVIHTCTHWSWYKKGSHRENRQLKEEESARECGGCRVMQTGAQAMMSAKGELWAELTGEPKPTPKQLHFAYAVRQRYVENVKSIQERRFNRAMELELLKNQRDEVEGRFMEVQSWLLAPIWEEKDFRWWIDNRDKLYQKIVDAFGEIGESMLQQMFNREREKEVRSVGG